ncbi:MAG: hypothetical protein ACK5BG_01385 [Pseudanabaena sp.]
MSLLLFFRDALKLQSICNSQPVNQQLGLYRVIECDRDSRGGIYFSTEKFSTMDSAKFHGFVYQPNPYGNYHFGSDIYEYYPIKGEWYGLHLVSVLNKELYTFPRDFLKALQSKAFKTSLGLYKA